MGGIRAELDQGDITPFDVFSIDPFGNGLDTFQMTVTQLRSFLANYPSTFSYSTSLEVYTDQNQTYQFIDNGVLLGDNDIIEFSLNDYISNVYADYFPASYYTYELTTADYIIEYIRETHIGNINYENCFRRESTLSILPSAAYSKLHIQNPVKDFLILNTQVLGKLTLYDMFGKMISSHENEKDIFVGDLSSGLYIAQLQQGEKTYSGKFVIN